MTMFAVTPRLTLRPGWPEHAAALAQAIGHEVVIRNLARAPWPYGVEDAKSFLTLPHTASEPRFQIFERFGAYRLIGGIGIIQAAGAREIDYWLCPDAWGFGYATEAGRAVLDIARRGLCIPRLAARHYVDNPASGRVLRKLGFRDIGCGRSHSLARGGEVETIEFAIDLLEETDSADRHVWIAA